MKSITALIAGILFGVGLAVSQMINPLKVLGFLDVLGHWDPSLALVMVGAIAVTLPGFALLRRREKPLVADRFQWPTRTDIDGRLVLGAAVFGIGWGLGGFCPGPGIAAISLGWHEPLVFTLSMVAGFIAWHLYERGMAASTDG